MRQLERLWAWRRRGRRRHDRWIARNWQFVPSKNCLSSSSAFLPWRRLSYWTRTNNKPAPRAPPYNMSLSAGRAEDGLPGPLLIPFSSREDTQARFLREFSSPPPVGPNRPMRILLARFAFYLRRSQARAAGQCVEFCPPTTGMGTRTVKTLILNVLLRPFRFRSVCNGPRMTLIWILIARMPLLSY